MNRQESLDDLRRRSSEQFEHWDGLIREAEAGEHATGWPAYELALMLRRENARIHEDAENGEFRNSELCCRLMGQLRDLQAEIAKEDETAFYIDETTGERLT